MCVCIINEAGQQIFLFTPHISMFVAPSQDCLYALKFLGRDQGFPVSTQCFRRNVIAFAHHPTRVRPVMKNPRQRVDTRLTDTIRLDFYKGTSRTMVIALRVERFLDILGQLIAGGQAVIDDDMKNPREYPPGVTVVGYKDEGFVYLLPEIAHREVNRVQPLRFTVTAIGMQLREDGILIPGPNNLSTQKRVRGGRVRFWQLTSESFVETVETDAVGEST